MLLIQSHSELNPLFTGGGSRRCKTLEDRSRPYSTEYPHFYGKVENIACRVLKLS